MLQTGGVNLLHAILHHTAVSVSLASSTTTTSFQSHTAQINFCHGMTFFHQSFDTSIGQPVCISMPCSGTHQYKYVLTYALMHFLKGRRQRVFYWLLLLDISEYGSSAKHQSSGSKQTVLYEFSSFHFADIYCAENVTFTFPLPSAAASPSGLSILPNRV